MKKQLMLIVGMSFLLCLGMDLDTLRRGAEARIVYRVLDDEGVPVSNAIAHVWFRSDYPRLEIKDWVMLTDGNGGFVAECKTNERLSIRVGKDGYYHAFDRVTFRSSKSGYKVGDGKWQPYGKTRTVVLKKIKNPYAVKVFSGEQCHRKIPVFEQWLPFDMEQSDWLAPYGKGVHNDVLLRFHRKLTDKWFDFAFSMEACFTNNPHAGFYIRPLDGYSDLKSSYLAETNATYCANYNFLLESVSKKQAGLDEGSYLVFRTRTRVDENGKLVGAHYGKYCGGWSSDGKEMHLGDGCFNPVENETSIEGDQPLLYCIRNYKKGK